MADVIELRPHLDRIEEDLLEKISGCVSRAIVASIAEDDAIGTDILLAEMETAARAVGLSKAKILLAIAWSEAIAVIKDDMETATRRLDEAGVFDDPQHTTAQADR